MTDITVDQLSTLKTMFKIKNETLTIEEFIVALEETKVPLDLYKDSLNETLENTKTISWSQFLDFLIKQNIPTSAPLQLQIQSIVDVPHSRRESIVKTVLIETKKYFCYAIISKHGRVGLYDGNLNFLTSYHIIMTRNDINLKEEQRRRRNRWVTDAIFCSDIQMFIVTNSARSITIYEASGLKHVPLWLILSTPNVVECFSYKSDENSILFMGDCNGYIFSFNFQQPHHTPLKRKHNDKISLFYWDELPAEKEFLVIKKYGKLHKDAIKQLKYCDYNDTLISCSKDESISLNIKVLRHKSKPPLVFQIPKGCNCFDISNTHRILITGSENGVLRLWNPLIAAKPIATLREHDGSKIVDVRIMNKYNSFVSISSDGNLKLWNLKEQKCLQSFYIHFPSFSVFGKSIEWGNESIYPGPKCEQEETLEVWERFPILIICCNNIALIKLFNENKNDKVFPPPPLQNSVLVPKMWKTSDTFESNETQSMTLEEVDVNLEEKLRNLDFILKKDLFENDSLTKSSDINFKIATLERRKIQMQQHVEKGAPYLALELHQVPKLHLTPNLPVPNKKRIRKLVDKIEKVLEDADTRDLIFSEPSSSRSPRSSRSSVIEFQY